MSLRQYYIRFLVFIVSFLLFDVNYSVAQKKGKNSKESNSWEIGVSVGASRFLNTINPNFVTTNQNNVPTYKRYNYWNSDFNPGISVSVIKTFSPTFSAEARWMTTSLSGSWTGRYQVPTYPASLSMTYLEPFKSGINQFDFQLVINLLQIVAPNRAIDKWDLFIKGGAGGVIVKAIKKPYPPPIGISDNPMDYVLVYGGGLSYRINKNIKLKFDFVWNRAETDGLDGVRQLFSGSPTEGTDTYYIYNIKERYIYPSIGVVYSIGTAGGSANKSIFGRRNKVCPVYDRPVLKKVKSRR